MNRVYIVATENWEALYIDDDLILEDHSIGVERALEIIGEKCPGGISFKYKQIYPEVMERLGWSNFPNTLTELREFIHLGVTL